MCNKTCSVVVLAWLTITVSPAVAEMSAEDAWKALPTYEYGQDMAPLLAIDHEVTQAMASAQSRSACAARLAGLLESAQTTPAARQFVCVKLQQVGTPAQILLLTKLLANAETSEIARQTLEAIPGEDSAAAIRNALGVLKGRPLTGAINSVGVRRDGKAVAKLQELAVCSDNLVAEAAIRALGRIADEQATMFLTSLAEKAPAPMPRTLAVAWLKCADACVSSKAVDKAKTIYTRLGRSDESQGIRNAAMEALFRLEKDQAATVLAWIAGSDSVQRRIAAGHLACLSAAQLDQLAERLADLPDDTKTVVLETLSMRQGASRLSLMLKAAQSDKPELRLVGIRGLGAMADSSTLPFLMDRLADGGDVSKAAQEALSRLPRKVVTQELLEAMQKRPEILPGAIEILADLRCYEAIDPLLRLAANEDPRTYEPALEGLRRIADPDKHDVPRLVSLLLKVPQGRQHDEVERTILRVCEKLPAGDDHAALVLAAVAKIPATDSPKYLPLLGRLGGAKALQIVETSLKHDSPEIKQAAVRALCNWPNPTVADRLWDLATHSDDAACRRSALLAYVRVVTLKSDRPQAETLAILERAMKQTQEPDVKQWVLTRASTVRTMDAVAWIAGYLDDPELAQTACHSIVELAHHRFLRHPNMDRFGPLLDKVSRTASDPAVAERAKKYRLGL
jgi:HEAT repeat protein